MTDPHGGQPISSAGPPLAESRRAAILLHGRNASPRNILDLVPRLDRPGFTYLAPAAANNTWYPLSFLADTEQNEPFLSSALMRLDTVVADVVQSGVPRDRIILMGFSQGACLASEFAYRHPARYAGLIAFSGGLIGPPGTTWSSDGRLNGMPVFFGCSDVDTHVPRSRVDESAEVFARLGASVTTCIYPGMGHLVNDDEIEQARLLMDRVSPTRV
jgi:predicted esterase